ncbi:MAG: EamA family transporter [bacterium]|nr:EamA family transporter [bacterium]MDE0668638.1 EamA family transporter [bacterium]MXZ30173.1 EamA family transporter [Acidimicrobiia bacterium]MYB24797.1 EamA family transporter [Acidimicrobiia bacterium]
MDVILGIGVAGGLGLADFFGGMAGRRTGPVRTVVGAQVVGGVIIGIYLLATWQPVGGTREILLALLAGGALTLGVGFMYTGFTLGRMAVVAPVTASMIAVLTFVVGLVRGERPSTLSLAGVALAIVAVVLISRPPPARHVSDAPKDPERRRTTLGGELGLSLAAGASLATFQTTIGEIGDAAGVAPLLVVRAAAITLSCAVLLVVWHRAGAPRPQPPRRSTVVPVVASGFLLLVAHALLLEALSLGLLSIVGPITALSPAFTVIPAWLFLNEHISRVQVIGMVTATAGLVLVALG